MHEVIGRLRNLPPPIDPILGPGILELVEIISSPYPGTSIVPDGCTVKWDRRLVLGESRESVLGGLREALAGIASIDVSFLQIAQPCYTGTVVDHDDFHPAWAVDLDSPLVQAALASVGEVGIKPSLCTIPYCSNGSGSAGELGIPSIVLGPGNPALFHVVDEHISVEQLQLGVDVYARLAARLLAP
jgi:acetylornithine deacetylase/succinyl-diaminopimelate desuccinylase-like protein